MKNKNKPKRLFLLKPIFQLLSYCSLTCLFKLARFFSFIIARTNNQVARQTRENIALCFSHKSELQRLLLYKKSIQHTTCSLFEMAALWHQPVDKTLSYVTKQEICSDYNNDTKAKIIIAPHYGSWELLILWLAQKGSFFTLYKPARSTQLDNYILSKRTRNGAQLMPTNTIGLRAIMKGLKTGSTAMILPDQKPKNGNAQIESTFYSHQASTTLLIKNLRKKINCSVYIAAIVRDVQTASYCVQIKPLNDDLILGTDQQSADYLNQQIEQFIAQDETQYQWSYRRFTQQAYEALDQASP